MRKTTNKCICLLLCLVLVLSMVPAVFAAEAETELFDISGSSMTLGNTLEINFAIDTTKLTGTDNYIVISKEYADERGTVTKTVQQSDWARLNASTSYVSYSVSAKEMNDKLTVIAYNADGEQLTETYEDSVAAYCLRTLAKEEAKASPEEKTLALFVDMLAYGAAAQEQWNYNTDAMADADLTEAQKGYATPVPEKNNILQEGVGYYGTSLSLKENILMNVAYKANEISDASYAVVTFVDHYGNDESVTVQAEDFISQGDNLKYISITAMAVADYRQAVTVTLYDAEGNAISTTVDSVESYLSRKSGALYDAIAAFGDGAYNYFHTNPGTGDNTTVITGTVSAEDGTVTEDTSFSDGDLSAQVPAGVQVEDSTLTLTVTEKAASDSGVALEEGQEILPLDIHIDGISAENATPIQVCLGKILPGGLNIGNVTLYHVEDGVANAMTRVMTLAELDAHNEFYYDPITGDITVAMATFSEVAMVSEEAAWKGERDYTWYNADAKELNIANADQLAGLSAIVGGMDGQTQDSFAGKTVKMVGDINIGDLDSENGIVFYPIGYYNTDGTYEKTGIAITSGFKNFEGEFDGQGHTISNFYQNTWEMKGDHNWYDATLQYYRDGMGLFGKVYGGAVRNLTVKNFSSEGEITTTGTIAAYADCGATFENIAIFNCNPRVYNIGNGGIVGCVGWYTADVTTEKVSFKNITVDNSNKISALWGSYDVACGGIVGQYYPTSGQSNAIDNAGIYMENCHVAAQMDVYNDVCANYQYYAYRYAGILIGSVRENVTVDGHSYPNMDGITASGCTVHFGDWNDYYYCELVDNSTASYTHDHQMSRLVEIKQIDGTTITYLDDTTGTVPASGRANYVIVDYTKGHGTANATCYHFLNGEVWTHDMAGIQEGVDENGDGEIDLKEDKQHIYLEFNNLVTGYGWGVTSKGVNDMDGVDILDREEGSSVKKFAKADSAKDSYTTGTTVTIGELFAAVAQEEDPIEGANVQVSVSPVGETSTAGGTYEPSTTDNWADGKLTFSGIGAATITITDYNFCTPTIINVEIVDLQPVEKFDKLFDGDFLYRVGNNSTTPVKLSSLFAQSEDYSGTIGTVAVTIENIDGTAGGTYTANATWGNGTIQFTGTGVVKVTITDNDYCIPTELVLEVVDGKNITSVAGSNGTDIVLLNDVTIASNGTANYTNCTVYGNGFTFDVRGGMNMYNSAQGHGIIMLRSATIDNLVVIGDVYDTYGAYSDQEDYTSALDASSSTIQNCYIANCSTPIRGNGVTVTNTTLYGGTIGNIIISGGTNTLTDVTTVNYNDGRGVVGFGIVISDGASDATKLVLNGTLKQYNFVSENDAPSDAIAKKLFEAMFDSAYSQYHFGTAPVYVNTGVLSMTKQFDGTDITDNTGNGYVGTTVSYNNATGYLYSLPASGNTVDNGYNVETDAHKATVQGDYLPTPTFSLGDQALSKDSDTDTRYMIGDINGVEALYQSNEDPLTLDITKLMSVSKYGDTNYTVSASCLDANGNALTANNGVVTLSEGGAYTLVFTVTDNIFYAPDGTALNKSVTRTYEVPLTLSVKAPDIKDAVITVNSTSITGTYEAYKPYVVTTEGYYLSFNPLSAITVTDYDASGTGTTVDLTANISSTNVEYANTTNYAWSGTTITITYTDGRVLTIYMGAPSGVNSPSTNNGGKTITVTNGAVKSDGYVGTASTGTWPITSYTFKGNSQSTVSSSSGVTVNFTAPSSGSGSGCFAEGTLITLADGTQKPIEEITYEDELLAWDLNTGAYATTTASLIESHETSENRVINLNFADGTTVRVIYDHGFFSVEENNFVYIDEENIDSYFGQNFVKVGENGTYTSTQLVGYEVTVENVAYYTIQTAFYNNCIAENMFTLTSPSDMIENDGWFDYFEIGEGMKYDEEKKQADIEKYGLYTYEDFAEYVTYEQFLAFNGPYLKVLVGRGVVTFEQILELIESYVAPLG